MAVHDYVIANGTGAAVRSDLNNALAAIVSNNSSSSEPGTTYAYQWWADTNANVLKIRNSSNDGWITLRELDGTMLIEDGSASAPGLAFAGDTDTGIAKNGTNGLMVTAGGVQRFSVSATEVNVNDTGAATDFRVESDTNTAMLIVDGSANRVGIGAATPAATLDVAGNQIFSAADPQIQFNAGGPIIKLPAANTLSFFTDSTNERARIDSSGRLLVGTSSARANFYNGSNTANILLEGLSSTTSTIAAVSNKINTDPNNEPTFVLGRSGTDSVGSTTVVANNNAVGRVSFQGTDGSEFVELAHIRGLVDGTPGANDMPGRLIFSTTTDGASTPTERMRINNAGQVGIGTTTVQHSVLAVAETTDGPTIEMRPNQSDVSEIHATKRVAGSNVPLNLRGSEIRFGCVGLGTSEAARINNSGTVCIGRTDSVVGTNKLAIEGDGSSTIVGIQTGSTTATVNFAQFFDANGTSCGGIAVNATTNTTSYITTSDYRLKENIVDITGGIARLNNLTPKRFNFIDDETQTTLDGFIAHEVQSVVPEAVVGNHNEVDDDNNPVYQGIDQSKLVPLLTAALQEAIAKIETLETKVAALEAG